MEVFITQKIIYTGNFKENTQLLLLDLDRTFQLITNQRIYSLITNEKKGALEGSKSLS